MAFRFLKIIITSSIASNGPFLGGAITSGILVTISGLMYLILGFSGSVYLALEATP